MPSKQPRTPEVEISEDSDSGFKVNIYDGEYPNPGSTARERLSTQFGIENWGGRCGVPPNVWAEKSGSGNLLKTKFEAIDSDAVFEVLEEHFDEEEYRIVNLKESVKTFPRAWRRPLCGDRGDNSDVDR